MRHPLAPATPEVASPPRLAPSGSPAAPLVSVVIPTYNRAAMVVDAVAAALRQTGARVEVIVVDDGSTDGTRHALAPFLDRILYVRQDNLGLAAARNRGIREARGDYVAFLDSDDRCEPHWVAAALRTFAAHPEAGAVFSAEYELDRSGEPVRLHTKRSPGPFFSPTSMLSRDTGVGCGRPPIVRRQSLERLGGFDESIRHAVDCEMWIRGSFQMAMVLQPEPVVARRIHGDNLSANIENDALDWMRILDRVRADHPEFVRDNARLFRRVCAKQHLRYGRELLAAPRGDRQRVRAARRALRQAIQHRRWLPRAWLYLLCSWVAPKAYGPWRRFELALRAHYRR